MSWLDSLEEIRTTDWSAASDEERAAKAEEVVTISAYAGALTAVVPLPMADVALLLPVHTAMVMTVGHVYGRPMGEAEAKRVVMELGAIAGLAFAGHAAIGFLKRVLLPGVGGLLSVPATFALTWAVGELARAYFKDPDASRDTLRSLFSDAIKDGKAAFDMEAFDRFRRTYGSTPSEAARPADGEPTPTSKSPDAAPAEEPAEPAVTPEQKAAQETLRPKKRSL